MLALGVIEIANGRLAGIIPILAAVGWGLYWGARYGQKPTPEQSAAINTENAKSSGLSRWRERRS
jgi:hypothetical protein